MIYLSLIFGAAGFIFGGWKGAAIGILLPVVAVIGFAVYAVKFA
jgi:hypothetical protein